MNAYTPSLTLHDQALPGNSNSVSVPCSAACGAMNAAVCPVMDRTSQTVFAFPSHCTSILEALN